MIEQLKFSYCPIFQKIVEKTYKNKDRGRKQIDASEVLKPDTQQLKMPFLKINYMKKLKMKFKKWKKW